MKTIFKVGDRVFDIRYGWGEVKEILSDKHSYPIYVKYAYNDDNYVWGGFNSEGDLVPMISFTEYTLQGFSQERPKKEPPIGSLCLFSDNKDEFDMYIGAVDLLKSIGDSKYYNYASENSGSYTFCKQIKIEQI